MTKRHREQERKLHKFKLASAKSCTDTTVPSVRLARCNPAVEVAAKDPVSVATQRFLPGIFLV